MIRQLLTFLVVVAVLGGGGYLLLYKRGEVERVAKGYSAAETPQQAADQFKKAIQDRDYEIAADYCTAGYAEQLRRGGAAARELGTALDNLNYQMKERGLVRDEVKLVFLALDPFPKDFQLTVSAPQGDAATATLVFADPGFKGDHPSTGTWALKPEIFQTYIRSFKYADYKTAVLPMKKDGDKGWKFDVPGDSALQVRVAYLNEKYKNYVNPMKLVTQEVKTDPTTKENATTRLKDLLQKAAQE